LPSRILGKSRMRKRACTDLCGGRSAMVVPTATVVPGLSGGFNGSLQHRLEVDFAEFGGAVLA